MHLNEVLADYLGTSDGRRPFALLRREGREHVEVLTGEMTSVERLADIPLRPGTRTLAVVPHRQIAERGFAVIDDSAELLCLLSDRTREVLVADVLAALPSEPLDLTDLGFDVDDAAYEAIVTRVLRDEIGRGEGSNFVIHRTRQARVADPLTAALTALRHLLSQERGAYWTFLVHTGDYTFVGASPERHVSVDDGLTLMNPISGTYRHPDGGADLDGLLRFLADPKEVNELAMVLDEELKMMAVVAEGGGQVVGPYLKEMSHLAHTEYLLAGRSTLDIREVLRETMFAPTVTGSPIENACRVIARHERRGRRYYGGVLALLDHDDAGGQRLDAPILIRTAEFAADGTIRVPVGATLVRDSTPAGEVAETHAKAAGVLAALGLRPAAARPAVPTRYADDPAVIAALAARNDRLSPFWLTSRAPVVDAPFAGRSVLIVDAEDTFTGMLAHLLRSLGMDVQRCRAEHVLPRDDAARYRAELVLPRDDAARRRAGLVLPVDDAARIDAVAAASRWLDGFDLVVAGPGPGDPADRTDPRVAGLFDVVRARLGKAALLAVCLGHQVLAAELGLALHRRAVPLQGTPMEIDLFGQTRRVGYYSTFTAVSDMDVFGDTELAREEVTGFVHALRGPGYAGVQFHPESVLTEHGPELLTALIDHCLHSRESADCGSVADLAQ